MTSIVMWNFQAPALFIYLSRKYLKDPNVFYDWEQTSLQGKEHHFYGPSEYA